MYANPNPPLVPITCTDVLTLNGDVLVYDAASGSNMFKELCLQLLAPVAWSGVTVSFQVSDDNTTFVSVPAKVRAGGVVVSSTTAVGQWNIPVLGRYTRVRVTARTSGTVRGVCYGSAVPLGWSNQTQNVAGSVTATINAAAANIAKAEDAAAANGDVGVFDMGVRRDTLTVSTSASGDYNEKAVNKFGAQLVSDFRLNAKTFRCSDSFNPVAVAGKDFFELYGNATTTVVVTRIKAIGTATALSRWNIRARRRSSANTGGTKTAFTVVPLETGDVAYSTPQQYSVDPTAVGTDVGSVEAGYLHMDNVSSPSVAPVAFEVVFGEQGKGLVLSGPSQGFLLSAGTNAPAGAAVYVTVEWYEF